MMHNLYIDQNIASCSRLAINVAESERRHQERLQTKSVTAHRHSSEFIMTDQHDKIWTVRLSDNLQYFIYFLTQKSHTETHVLWLILRIRSKDTLFEEKHADTGKLNPKNPLKWSSFEDWADFRRFDRWKTHFQWILRVISWLNVL